MKKLFLVFSIVAINSYAYSACSPEALQECDEVSCKALSNDRVKYKWDVKVGSVDRQCIKDSGPGHTDCAKINGTALDPENVQVGKDGNNGDTKK